MSTTYAETPAELVFPPQVPFSWTLRWARKHRLDRAKETPRTYRIAGSAGSGRDLAAAIAFCEAHGAKLELD